MKLEKKDQKYFCKDNVIYYILIKLFIDRNPWFNLLMCVIFVLVYTYLYKLTLNFTLINEPNCLCLVLLNITSACSEQ